MEILEALILLPSELLLLIALYTRGEPVSWYSPEEYSTFVATEIETSNILPSHLLKMITSYVGSEQCLECNEDLDWETDNPQDQPCQTNCGHRFHKNCIFFHLWATWSSYPCRVCQTRVVFVRGPSVNIRYRMWGYVYRNHQCPACGFDFDCFEYLDIHDNLSLCQCDYCERDCCPSSTLVESVLGSSSSPTSRNQPFSQPRPVQQRPRGKRFRRQGHFSSSGNSTWGGRGSHFSSSRQESRWQPEKKFFWYVGFLRFLTSYETWSL